MRPLIDVLPPVERAVLVAAPRKGSADSRAVEEHLEELARLVDTAGAEVVARLTQQVAAPNPATLLGEGKVEELRALAEGEGATLVIFDEELTPVQGANLERELKARVMDRPEVILDIFSTRARSHEAKLQVELAQLEYLLPRLTRMWTHLSRIRGGIGLRGPGETQLETDRRIIRRKIQQLKAKLRDVARHRANLRGGREEARPPRRSQLSAATAAVQKSSLRPVDSLTTPRSAMNSSSNGSVGVPPWSTRIAKRVFGNRFAAISTASIKTPPATITRSYDWRAATASVSA